jgi:hypothetical protein
MAEIDGTDLLRFDFETPVNAVGLTVLTRSDYSLIELEAYDATGLLIDQAFFLGDVIDGTILGSDYGQLYDVDYGFFGVYTPESEIAYALLRGAPFTGFDDLHCGVIPEPTTVFLLILGIPLLLKGRRRWPSVTVCATATVLTVGLLSTPASAADISGTVTGYATPFNPEYLPDTPTNPPQVMDLEGVRVWLTPEVSTYTLADGSYEFNDVSVTPPVTVSAELVGEWVKVQHAIGTDLVPNPPSYDVTAFPAPGRNFTFNPSPHSEYATAQVNAFVHVSKAHDFWKRFQPEVIALDFPVDSEGGMSTNLVIKGEQL